MDKNGANLGFDTAPVEKTGSFWDNKSTEGYDKRPLELRTIGT